MHNKQFMFATTDDMKVSRRIGRYLLLTLGGLLAVIAVTLLAVNIYAQKPYIEITEVRVSDQPLTLQVTAALVCEEAFYAAADGRRYVPYIPAGGKSLDEDFSLYVPGHGFILTGYPYKAVLRNIFTGTVVEEHSERFDVLAWSIVIPYRTLGENGEELESSKPLSWKSNDLAPVFVANTDRPSRSGC